MSGDATIDNRPTVLFLFFGPRWRFEHEFDARLESLQTYIRPYFFTSTDSSLRVRRGDAELRSFDYRKKLGLHKLIYYYRYLSHALIYAREIQAAAGQLGAVVSCDPLATGLMGRFIAWRLGAPLICEINGCFDDKALYAGRPTLGPLRRRINLAVIRWTTGRSAGVKKLFDGQLSKIISDNVPSLCLFDHVETDHFYQSEGEKVILAIGAPFFPKGFGDLVLAFQRLSDARSDWRLRIVGHFSGDYSSIQSIVNDHPRIEICKAMMPDKIPGEMASASIFVLPSRSEGVPRVLLEAMAAGTARIASSVGGIPSLITDNEDGLLFEAGDVEQLIQKLGYLMDRPLLQKQFGDAGLERLNHEFALDIYTRRYAEFLLNIVKRADNRSATGS